MELETISCKDFLFSVEANEKQEKLKEKSENKYIDESNNPQKKHMAQAKKAEKRTMWDSLKELPAKADNLKKNAQLWARKRKNLFFYKKYLDRVQSGLYDRYADKAYVVENTMIDDPVNILKGPAQQYLHDIVEDINKLYTEVLKMSKDLENKTTSEQCIMVIKKYCDDYIGQNIKGEKVDQESLSWKIKLLHSTKYKIAKILLRNGERKVYGYTTKNMVLKGYPKPNHLIVTMFVANPEERPTKQTVSEIFRSSDSFAILADSDKQDIFNVGNMTEAALTKTVDGKVMNEIKISKENAIKSFKATNVPNKKDEGKIIDEIWDGIKESCKELLSRKNYIMDCINIYFDMILRIDKLGVQAIKNMLALENADRDKNYDKHSKISHLHDSNKYDKDGNLVSTKYDRKSSQNARDDGTYDINTTGKAAANSAKKAVKSVLGTGSDNIEANKIARNLNKM